MLKMPSRDEYVGCLFGILGILIGPSVILRLYPPPPGEICGNMFIPVVFGGWISGGLGGLIVGMALCQFFPPSNRKKSDSD